MRKVEIGGLIISLIKLIFDMCKGSGKKKDGQEK